MGLWLRNHQEILLEGKVHDRWRLVDEERGWVRDEGKVNGGSRRMEDGGVLKTRWGLAGGQWWWRGCGGEREAQAPGRQGQGG